MTRILHIAWGSAKWLFRYSGTLWICRQFKPKDDSPPVGPLWLLGIYVALAGIAASKQQGEVDTLERRTDTVVALLAAGCRQPAQAQLVSIQQATCSVEPSVFCPMSVWKCLIGKQESRPDTVERVKTIVSSMRSRLDRAFLPGIDLARADLYQMRAREADFLSADFRGTFLRASDFQSARLSQASFHGACLTDSDLSKADLENADFTGAIMMGVKFVGANCRFAKFANANLVGSDFTGATDLTFEQLAGAKLEGVTFPDYLGKKGESLNRGTRSTE